MRLLKVLLMFFAVLAILLWSSAKWYFWEPSYFTQDSWAYKLKVDSSVKSFPIWAPATEPRYLLRVADGEKRSTIAVHYQTEYTKSELLTEIDKLEFACTPVADNGTVCEKQDNAGHSISIIIGNDKEQSNLTVEVVFIGLGDE